MGKTRRLAIRLLLETKSTSIERTYLYKSVMDYLLKKCENNRLRIGKMVILPSSFSGRPRSMHETKFFRFNDNRPETW